MSRWVSAKRKGGGRKKAAILSDVCESLIGAVFVDGGFAAAEALVLSAWGDRITADAEPARDAKTAVQEWAQSRALGPPRYEEVERSGPAHAPHFVMRVALEGFDAGDGAASSKRAAEQAAAQAFLDRWGGSGVSETRCGFVALIGAPNAGKSTLINALVGEKVSIVTRKAQTTRSTVRGVLTKGEAQIVFVDTPGLFAPKRRLDRAMVASAWGAAADADALVLLIDARKEAGQASRDRGDPGDPDVARRKRGSRGSPSSTRSTSSSGRSCWSSRPGSTPRSPSTRPS